ncbi:MAG: tandem-95 repeat protein [Magnetospirillum sp.]|nr:tandem-95 repeat protein [Magnetospirillum sp.]
MAPGGKTFAVYAAGSSLGVMLDGQAVALQALPGRTTSIVVDEWTHVAVSFDTSGRLELLRNGEVVAYATGLNLSGYAASGGTLVLGQDQALAGGGFVNTHAMLGALDSVRVWNTARSAVDVQDGMDGTFSTGTTGLVASYSLDDVSGNTVANGVGGTNTLARFGDLGRAGLVTRIEDQGPYTTVLHGIDVDAGDTLTYSLTAGGGTDGTTTLTADGSLSFTPTANFHGTHTVSVEVTDSHGATYSRNLDIVVTAANDAPTPVTRSTYDFEGLTAGQTIDGQDGWVANNTDVTTVGTVASSGLYVGSTAYSPGTVAGVARVISRLADGDFAMPAVAAGDKIVLEYDFTPNYWGAGLQLGYDANSDGDLIGDTGEVAIGVGFRQEGGERVAVYDALGNATETAFDLTVGYNEWARFRLTLDTAANGGQGALSVQLRDLTHAGAWTTVVQNVNAHLDFNAITTANPNLWNGLVFAASNAEAKLDNISYEIDYASVKPVAFTGTTAAPIVISDADLLANFSDVDGDALHVQSITASNGTVSGDGNGHWLVTPPTAGGTINLGYVVADGHGGIVNGSATVAATFVNHAPVLDIGATPTLPIISEDFVPSGGGLDGATMVSSLLAARTSDVDGTATPRMAVVGADTTHGSWFYSTDWGATWSAMGAVSETSARLLGDSNHLRFVPMGDWNGTATISYRGVDVSCLAGNGSLVDASVNGGTTAFSAAAETASISVTAVDDTPVALGPRGDVAAFAGDYATRTLTLGTAVTVEFRANAPADARMLDYAVGTTDDAFSIWRDAGTLTVSIAGVTCVTNIPVEASQWHHWAVTWNKADGAVQVFKDGTLAWTGSNIATNLDISGTGTLALAQDRTAGGSLNGTSSTVMMDDVRVWNTVRTASDIKSKINETISGGDPNYAQLAAQWSFDGGTLNDSSGNTLTLTEVGAIGQYAASGEGAAIAITGLGVHEVDGQTVQVMLTGVGGALTLGSITGVTFTTGDGSNDTTMSFSGSVADVNAALATLTYAPTAGFVGAHTVTMQAGDFTNGTVNGTSTANVSVEVIAPLEVMGAATRVDQLRLAGSDYASASVPLSSEAGTVELWLQKGQWNLASTDEMIIGNNIRHDVTGAVYLSDSASYGLHFRYGGVGVADAGNNAITYNGSDSWTAGSWHHLAISWERTAGLTTLKLYADGTMVGSTTPSLQIPADKLAEWVIGKELDPTDPLQGSVTDVRLWTTARSQAEIADAMHTRLDGTETGLAANWTFEGGATGGVIEDASGHGHTLGTAHSVSDDFSSNTLDPSKWTVVSGNTTGHALSVAGGRVVSTNRDLLCTKDQFVPTADHPVVVTGTWVPGEAGNLLSVVTRGDASSLSGSSNAGHGIVAWSSANNIYIWGLGDASGTVGTATGDSTLTTVANHTYAFEVVDDGTHVTFNVRDLDDAANTASITAASSYASSTNQVIVYGREGDGTNTYTSYFDNLSVEQARATVLAPPAAATRFDGDDALTTAAPVTTATDNVTLEAWVNWDGTNTATTKFILYNGDGSFSGYGLGVHDNGVLFLLAGGVVEQDIGYSLRSNEWTHLAAVRDNGTWKIYIGDEVVYTTTGAVPNGFGGNPGNTLIGQAFTGEIADARIWTVARSGAEIAETMDGSLTGSETGLAAWWPLADATGLNLKSGGATATASGAPVATEAGPALFDDTLVTSEDRSILGKLADTSDAATTYTVQDTPDHGTLTLNADGSFLYKPTIGYAGSDSFTVHVVDGVHTPVDKTISITVEDTTRVIGVQVIEPHTAGVHLDGNSAVATTAVVTAATANVTLEAWAKVDEIPSSTSRTIFGNGTQSSSGYCIQVDSTGHIGLSVWGVQDIFSTTVVNLGEWHHYAAVLGTGNAWTLYMDGQSILSTTAIAAANTPNGATTVGNTGGVGFTGEVAEARIWTVAKTQAEIVAGMNTIAAGTEAGLAGHWSLDGTLAGGTLASPVTLTAYGNPTFFGNEPVVAEASSLSTTEDGVIQGTLVAEDGDGAVLTFGTITNGTTAHGGHVTVAADGSFTYHAPTGYAGEDSFTVAANDGSAYTTSGTISVTVVDDTRVLGAVAAGGRFHSAGDSVIALSNATSLATAAGSFTWETWVRSTATAKRQDLIDVHGINTSFNRLYIGADNKLHFENEANAGPTSAATVADGGWHHVAAVYDATAGSVQLLVDGVASGAPVSMPVNVGVNANDTAVTLGGLNDQSVYSNMLVGELDNTRIWSTARTADQIQAAMHGQPAASEPGLLGSWTFNEGDDGAVDHAGGNNTGRIWTRSPWHLDDTVLHMAGGSGIAIASPSVLFTNGTVNPPLTLEAWVRTSKAGVTDLIRIGQASDADVIFWWINGGTMHFSGYDGVGTAYGQINGTTVVNDGEWHHLAVTISGSNTVSFYIDGLADAVSGTLNGHSFNPTQVTIGNGLLGEMADARIWQGVLPQNEISSNMNVADPTSINGTLAGHWPLDEGSGTTVVDSAGNDNSGTVTGGSWVDKFTSSGIIDPPDTAMHFDGSSFVSLGDVNNLGTGDFTIETWINPATLASDQIIMLKGKSDDPTGQIALMISGGRLVFAGGGLWDATNGWHLQSGMEALKAGEWQHVAVTRQGSSYSLYLGGTLIGTATGTANYDYTNAYDLRIGSHQVASGGGGADFFSGEIADFRIWNKALTEDQLWDSIETPATGSEPGLVGAWALDGDVNDTKVSGGHNGTVTGTATYVATGPLLADTTIETGQNVPYHGSLLAADGGGDAITWGTITNGDTAHGTVTVAADGSFTYTPDAGFTGSDSFIVAANDASSHDTTATITVNVEQTVFSGVQDAGARLRLDGSADYASATGIDLANKSFTWEFWANRASAINNDFALGQGETSANNMRLYAGYLGSPNNPNYFSFNLGNNQILYLDDTNHVGEWIHWAGSYDVGENEFVLYKNGVEVARQEAAGPYLGSGSLTVGNAWGGYGFHGELDDIRIWEGVRTADEIRVNYDQKLGGGECGLVANWIFDGDASWGGHVEDHSTANHDLILAGGSAAPTLIDPPNMAVSFADTSSYLQVSAPVLTATDNLTMEAWAKADSLGPDRFVMRSGASGSGYAIAINNGVPEIVLGGVGTMSATTITVGADEWHHYAITRSNGSWSLYVDGVKAVLTDTSLVPLTPTTFTRIGESGAGAWDGEIADVRLWTTARSQADIQTFMSERLSGIEPNLAGYWRLDDGTATDSSIISPHDMAAIGTVTYATNGPDIHTLSIETNEDTVYRGMLDGHDAVDALTWGTITGGTTAHGTVTVNADGSFAYTPTAGFHGSDSFTVTNSANVSQTVNVTVWDSTEPLGINTAGSQLQFDGVNDYATATLAGNPLSTRATVEFWVSLQRLGLIQDLATLSDGNGHTVVVEVNAAGQLSVLANGTSIISSTTALSTSSWSHVAVVSNETGFSLFVNGSRVAGASTPVILSQNTTQTLKLGTDAGNFTEAAFDDVRVWSDARTAEEIHDSYLRASATESDNMVGRWNFNSSSCPLNDLSGYGNTMVLGDGAYNSPSAPLVINPPGRVVKFDGIDDHMTVGALTLTGGSYTLEAWVKPTASKDEVIADLGRGSTSEIILRADAAGHLQLVSTSDGVTFGTLTSTGSLAGGQWSHVAVVNNGGAVQVYVDGAYFPMNGGTLPTPTGSVTLTDNIIGWDGENTNTAGDAFAGMLGDVRLWTTARSSSEIVANMNTRLQGGESGLLANWRLDDLSSGTATVADDNAVAGGATDATLVGFSGQTYVVSSKGSSYGQSLTVAEDTFYSGRVTAYDSVTGGTIATGYSLVGSTKTAHGLVSITADGTTTYTPDANFSGTDSFVFQVADPQGGLATSQTITVQVTADANGPSTATWGGGTGSWNMFTNWTGQETPGAETAVTIAGGSADYYTSGTFHPTAASLAMAGGTFSVSGGTFDLAGNASVGAGALLRMTGGQLSGSGSLTSSGTMSLTGGSIGMAVVNQGLAMFDAAMLTLTAGWDNTTGTFEFGGSGYGHSVMISGGTFVNAGTVHVQASTGHTVSGAFKNAGLLDVDGSLTLEHGGRIIELAGGTIDVSTGNTLTIDAGTTNLTGSVAVIGGGSVTLAGNHTLNVGSGYTHTGGKFLGMGGTVTVVGSGTFTNAGTLTVEGDTNDIWSVAVANSGRLNVLGNAAFNVANGLSNTGTIELNGTAAAMTGGINVTGGTLVNQAGGLIHVGAGMGTEVISGAFKTLGRLDIDDDLTLSHNGAVIDVADGTIDVAAGSRLTIDGGTTKLDGKVTLTGGGTVDFAGVQTLDIGTGFILTAAAADLLSMSGSVTIAGTGTFTNQGSFTIDNNDDAFTAALTNAGTIDVFSGMRNGTPGSGGLHVGGGMVNTGLLMLDNAAGYANTIDVGAGKTLVNQGSITIRGSGSSSISGDFDNQGSLYATSNLDLYKTAGSLINSGTMTLADAKTLSVSGGADLLNTGLIDGAGTINLYGATLTNQGTLVAGGTGGLSISGGYAMSDFAELDVSVQGSTAPVATSLHMTSGTALLDGTLKVSFLNHMPTDGQVITVVYGSHSGEFMGDDGVADTGDEIEVVGLGADWTASLDYSSPTAVTVTFHMVDKSSFDATSGTWGTAANWLGSDIPSTAETAEIAVGKSVQVDTAAAASSITDAGSLALVAGGTLTVGTTLLVASGGALDLSGGVLSGGTVIVEGAVSLHSGTIACGGAMEVYSAVNLTDATMTLDRALDLWGVTTLNDTQFSGAGTIDLFGNSTLAGFDSFAGMVINDGTMALNGATGAAVGRFGGGLDNDGVIETTGNISGGGSHILDGHVINDGLIHVSGADLSFTGATLTNHGTLSIDMGHTFDVNRAGADFTSDGLLTGSGTLDLTGAAPFTNHGAISGSLTIEGDVVLGADSDLRFGAANDRLDVNGHLTLGGDLDVSYSGWGGGAASLVSWDSASGYFDSINGLDQGANGVLDITFGSISLSVTHQTAVAGMTSGNDVYQGIVSAGVPMADYVGGSGGDDTIFGNGGADVLFGGDGDDHLHISDGTFHFLDGGAGTDTLHLDGNTDFTAIRDDILQNFEVIDLTFAGNQTVTLNASDLAHLCGGTNAATGVANSMVIIGNAGDTVNMGDAWTATAGQSLPNSGNSYTQYANAATGVTVYVDDNITQNIGGPP